MTDRLHDFARAVADRQAQHAQRIDEAMMKDIALSLGMSEDEIMQARAEGAARKERAVSLRQRGLIKDAIDELEQASSWNPLDVEVLTMLADCYVRRGRAEQSAADLEKGRQLALQVLQIAPGNREAPQILQVIQMNPVKEGGSNVVAVIAVVVAVIAVLAGLAFWIG